jgi:rhamnosyltransferase subunit B
VRITLIPIGSAGDVHPLVGVGQALLARGHDVSVITNPHFATTVEEAGLRLIPFGTVEQYEVITSHPLLWNSRHGLEVIAAATALGAPELYRLIEREHRAGTEVMAGGSLAFAARVAQDVLGVRFVTVHLSPSQLLSVHDFPIMHPRLSGINCWPRLAKRAVLSVIDRVCDRFLGPCVNRLRTEHGLPAVRHIATQWWHSPLLTLGLFPEWYAPPQPDWPPQVTLTGFPLFDEGKTIAIPTDVERFLNDAEPPLVFVAGSGNRQGRQFYAAAAEACARLGRRGLLLTRYPEQLPAALPAGVRHVDYLPLSQVLPRAAALVHHGGIGTAAQGLAAGVPQLVMPMTFDQPDNLSRLSRLGVARSLPPDAFEAVAVTRELETLLGSPEVTAACADVARRFDGTDPIARTCELIENAAQ